MVLSSEPSFRTDNAFTMLIVRMKSGAFSWYANAQNSMGGLGQDDKGIRIEDHMGLARFRSIDRWRRVGRVPGLLAPTHHHLGLKLSLLTKPRGLGSRCEGIQTWNDGRPDDLAGLRGRCGMDLRLRSHSPRLESYKSLHFEFIDSNTALQESLASSVNTLSQAWSLATSYLGLIPSNSVKSKLPYRNLSGSTE